MRNLDNDPAIQRDHILGRRYALDADEDFPQAKAHCSCESAGHFPQYGRLPLARGTVVQVVHVEEIDSGFIEGGLDENQVQGIVINGPQSGARVSVGTVPYFLFTYAEFEAVDPGGGLDKASGAALVPWPNTRPDWLDTDVLPPRVKPVPSEEMRKSLYDPDWAIRFYALRELVRRNPADPQTVKDCQAALFDDVSEVRHIALDVLAKGTNPSAAVLDTLARRFSDPMIPYDEADSISDALLAAGPPGMNRVAALLNSKDQGVVQA
ncbi:MAG TPA: HEAT repeat domain-containing protein, partial [Tepidisphaeraceae bacterium]|nr:HEAT repeat domain-containing protein [Tepidisphaeraceae bacterium]